MMNSLTSFLLLLFLSFVHNAQSKTPVFAIDLGSQLMKIAIVKPGVPMDIALNRESDRKTPVAVSIRKGARGLERAFGEPALQLSVRHPRLVYQEFLPLVGKTCCDHPHIRAFIRKHPQYSLRPHPVTGHVQFVHDDENAFTAEELLAMVLEDARNIVEGYAGVEFNDVAITVPPYLTQMERRAVLRAATNLTGLNVFELMNSNTAGLLFSFTLSRPDLLSSSHMMNSVFDYRMILSRHLSEHLITNIFNNSY
jgi:hypoxia up-regulated 1